MTRREDRDDRTATAGGGEGGAAAEPAAGPMRFTVLDRRGDRVHLVSVDLDSGTLFGHPSVCEQVWQEALAEVPPGWEIVDLCPVASGDDATAVTAGDDGEEQDLGLNDFAARKYELFLAFLGAGFERCEALTLVIETLHASDG